MSQVMWQDKKPSLAICVWQVSISCRCYRPGCQSTISRTVHAGSILGRVRFETFYEGVVTSQLGVCHSGEDNPTIILTHIIGDYSWQVATCTLSILPMSDNTANVTPWWLATCANKANDAPSLLLFVRGHYMVVAVTRRQRSHRLDWNYVAR